ncbi:MAG: zinc ribbon domain-containing protein [Candidatus Hermodarchaeota archaeon]
MGEDKYRHRYYYKESYEAAIGTFAVAIVFLFVAILSLFFLHFGIPFIGLAWWGYWLFIPAFFIFIGGFEQLYRNYKYKQVVKNALAQRNFQGTYKLEHIALEIGMKPNILLRVLLDLRTQGIVQYSFDAESGQIILGQKITYKPATEYVAPPKKIEEPLPTEGKNYCVYCGHKIESAGNFCPNCGSKL